MSLSRMFFLTNCVYWLDYSPPNSRNKNNCSYNSYWNSQHISAIKHEIIYDHINHKTAS